MVCKKKIYRVKKNKRIGLPVYWELIEINPNEFNVNSQFRFEYEAIYKYGFIVTEESKEFWEKTIEGWNSISTEEK
jgi:hypothetical protein